MKTLKLLSILVFAVFLVSTVSAVTVISYWEDESQSITITEGESVNFDAYFVSGNFPMTINIKLLDSQNNLVDSINNPIRDNFRVNERTYYLEDYNLNEDVYGSAGNYKLKVSASDTANPDEQILTLDLTVNAVNAIPQITSTPVTQINEGEQYSYDVMAIDVNFDPLTYSLTQAPSWLSIDPDTGLITGTAPAVGSDTTYNIEIKVSDGEDFDTQSYILTVIDISVQDLTAPVITLLGNNPESVALGDTYTDAGATALDDVDGTWNLVSANIDSSDVNTNVVGTYYVYYNVQDSAGNDADEVIRTVSVVEAIVVDEIAPVITLLGNNPESVALGDTYTDAGATALDDVDGTWNLVSANIDSSDVNTNVVGTYYVYYNVQDSAGNDAIEVTRTVDVFDPNDATAPVITVITPEEDKEYDDSELTFEVEVDEVAEVKFSLNGGSEITMDYQGMSNGILTFVYDVDLDDGNHKITFYATDAAGNTASIIVEFSVDTSTTNDKDDESHTNYYQSNYEEQLYLDQYKPSKIIYLEAEDQPGDKDLNFWQRFIEWLKDLFGF